MAEVRYTTLFQMTGEDQPRPGTSMAHFTFSVFDQVRGRAGASATPLAEGPRKPGQFEVGDAESDTAPRATPATTAQRTVSELHVMTQDTTAGSWTGPDIISSCPNPSNPSRITQRPFPSF